MIVYERCLFISNLRELNYLLYLMYVKLEMKYNNNCLII